MMDHFSQIFYVTETLNFSTLKTEKVRIFCREHLNETWLIFQDPLPDVLFLKVYTGLNLKRKNAMLQKTQVKIVLLLNKFRVSMA